MRQKTRATVVALLAAAAMAVGVGTAAASATFDPDTGTGFVGKGDVQKVFGWNNQTLQSSAAGVAFAYSSETDTQYDVTCEFDTTTGGRTPRIVHHVINKKANVGSAVAYDVTKANRNNPRGDVTGFNLTGKANETTDESGSVPVVGDPCPGGQPGLGLITDVAELSSTITQVLTVVAPNATPAATALDGNVVWRNGASVN